MKAADVPYFHLAMKLDDLVSAPACPMPAGYGLSSYRPGDEASWARIEREAGEFPEEPKALAHFQREFMDHVQELRQRCLFLHAADGSFVGTTTAWFGEHDGAAIGRLHWVAIVPAFQGRGLCKPLVSACLQAMRRWHSSAYLTTQTTSWIAVKVYLDFGFRPVLEPASREGWAAMARLLRHPALADLG